MLANPTVLFFDGEPTSSARQDQKSVQQVVDCSEKDISVQKVTQNVGLLVCAEYVAVFKTRDGKLLCARNPTVQLAKFGPPSQEWFENDVFRIEDSDLLPLPNGCDISSCSKDRSISEKVLYEEPMREALYHGKRVSIDWVCARRKGGSNNVY